PVASLAQIANVMEVHPSVPAATIPEFIDYARANAGKLNMASGGTGTMNQVAGELFNMMTGIRMQHVPYRVAAPALTDLLGGRVQVMFDNVPSSIGHIRGGGLRALGVTTTARLDSLPDVPTIDSFVPNYEASAYFGIGAPRNTPAEIVDKLNAD